MYVLRHIRNVIRDAAMVARHLGNQLQVNPEGSDVGPARLRLIGTTLSVVSRRFWTLQPTPMTRVNR